MYLRRIYKTEDKELRKNKTFSRQQQNAYKHDKKKKVSLKTKEGGKATFGRGFENNSYTKINLKP